MTDRQSVSKNDLDIMVYLAVFDKVGSEQSFTAHDITRTLREVYPDSEIVHKGVKAEVKRMYDDGEMAGYVSKPATDLPGGPIRYEPDSDPD